MADHYSILGVSRTASDVEIKTAFRKLAKLYHPDKNPDDPNAKIIFQQILKAYNTLIHPTLRRRYDSGSIVTPDVTPRHNKPKHKGQKEWNMTDEDIKRREYYKNYYKAKKRTVSPEEPANTYNDYKYVLFATPLAVGLLMLIIAMFKPDPVIKTKTQSAVSVVTNPQATRPENGDKPYQGYFGGMSSFKTNYSLQINNATGYDAVIVLFDKKSHRYIQHSYLRNSFYAEFSMLPETGIYWKSMIGKQWNPDKMILDNKITGSFDSIVQYQDWIKKPVLFDSLEPQHFEELMVIKPKSKNKSYISNDKGFFEKDPELN
jgi:hypothetical protein